MKEKHLDFKNLKRDPIFLEIDTLEGDEIQREQFLIENPIGGSLKISNGFFKAHIYMTRFGIEVFVKDRNGKIEKLEKKTFNR